MIDLHTHSTASDGQYTPADLMRLAAKSGISTIALTDHDTVDGIPEARAEADKLGLSFIPGIEISVKGPVKELHILGYYIDIENESLKKMCRNFVSLREERKERIFKYLDDFGVHLTKEEVEKYSSNGLVARPHFARAMVDAGYVATTREAFDKYLATPAFDKIERPKPMPEEGIKCILEAGGIPVLAHPVQTKLSLPDLEELVISLKEAGLKGIECYYSTHTKEQTQSYLELAKKYNLIVTGGSDFHGEKVKPDICLGTGINNSLCVMDSEILRLGSRK